MHNDELPRQQGPGLKATEMALCAFKKEEKVTAVVQLDGVLFDLPCLREYRLALSQLLLPGYFALSVEESDGPLRRKMV